MNKVLTIGKHTFKNHISSKIFTGSFVFSLIVFLFIEFFSKLSFGESTAVLKNSGLFLIEFINVLIVVYLSSTYILKEIEEKSIYLVLTKGVKKTEYILGVNLGLIYLSIINTLLMGVVLSIIVLLDRSFDMFIITGLIFIMLKLMILGAVGVLFSALVESPLFAMIATLLTYLVGHFLSELSILIRYTNDAVLRTLLKIVSTIFPKFYLLNYRDYLTTGLATKEEGLLVLYAIAYTIIIIFISNIAFKKRQL